MIEHMSTLDMSNLMTKNKQELLVGKEVHAAGINNHYRFLNACSERIDMITHRT